MTPEQRIAQLELELAAAHARADAFERALVLVTQGVSIVEELPPVAGQHVASPGEGTPDSATRSPGAARTARYRERLRAKRASQRASPSVTGAVTVTAGVTGEVVKASEPKGSEALEKDASTPYFSPVTPSVTGVTPSQGGAIPSTLRGIAPVEHFTLAPPPAVEKKPARRPADPRTAPLRDALVAAYLRVAGAPYPFDGPKDGPAVGRLVRACPDDAAILAAWERAMGMVGYPGTRNLATFASRLPELLGRTAATGRPLTPAEDRSRRAPIRAGDVDWSRT